MIRIIIGWAIGSVIGIAACFLFLPHDSIIGGLIGGGIASLIGIAAGCEWDLRAFARKLQRA